MCEMSQQLLNRLPWISAQIHLVPGEWQLIWLTLEFLSSITIKSASPTGQHLISLKGQNMCPCCTIALWGRWQFQWGVWEMTLSRAVWNTFWFWADWNRCSLSVSNLQTFPSHTLSLCRMSDLQKITWKLKSITCSFKPTAKMMVFLVLRLFDF